MKNALMPIITLLFFFSCEKEEKVLTDDIFYSRFNDNIELNSVRTYSTQVNPNCQDIIPIPIDSIVEYYFDLNADFVNDYKIKVEHGRYNNVSTGHCAFPSTYLISIEGANGAMVAMNEERVFSVLQMDSLFAISPSLIWKESGYLKMNGDAPGLLLDVIEMERKYIGLKFQDYYGWLKFEPLEINGIRLVEFAYNNTKGYSILAGQQD